MFHPCIGAAKEVVEDSRHGIMIRCKDAAREREKVNATGIELGFLNGRIPKETLKDGTLGTSWGFYQVRGRGLWWNLCTKITIVFGSAGPERARVDVKKLQDLKLISSNIIKYYVVQHATLRSGILYHYTVIPLL